MALSVDIDDELWTGRLAEDKAHADALRRVLLALRRLSEVTHAVSPADVQARIEAAMERRITPAPYSIQITSDGHTVLLRGRVSCEADRTDAERAALRTPGVLAVRNELVVP